MTCKLKNTLALLLLLTTASNIQAQPAGKLPNNLNLYSIHNKSAYLHASKNTLRADYSDITGITGISLSLLGKNFVRQQDLINFTQYVRAAFYDLQLDFTSEFSTPTVTTRDHIVQVSYRQQPILSNGKRIPLVDEEGANGEQTFTMKKQGRQAGELVHISNETYRRLGNLGASLVLEPPKLTPQEIYNLAWNLVDSVPVVFSDNTASRNAREHQLPFKVETVQVEEVKLFIDRHNNAAVVYEVLVRGTYQGIIDGLARQGQGMYSLFVDGNSGANKHLKNHHLHASATTPKYSAIGKAVTYDVDPITTPIPINGSGGPTRHNIANLDETKDLLEGRYARITTELPSPAISPVKPPKPLEFLGYLDFPPGTAELVHSYESQAYTSVDNFRRFLKTIGFEGILDHQLEIEAFDTEGFSSLYNLIDNIITLLSVQTPDAHDTVVYHEYGHAIQDDSDMNGVLGDDFPFNTTNNASQSLAAAEGTADAVTAMFVNDPDLFKLLGQFKPDNHERTLENTETMDNFGGFTPQENGVILGAAIWDGTRVGLPMFPLLLHSFNYVTPSKDFLAILETAIIQADKDLYNGQHEQALRRLFSIRKIGSFPWTCPTPLAFGKTGPPDQPGPYTVPYDDNIDETISHTPQPGAPFVQFVLGHTQESMKMVSSISWTKMTTPSRLTF